MPITIIIAAAHDHPTACSHHTLSAVVSSYVQWPPTAEMFSKWPALISQLLYCCAHFVNRRNLYNALHCAILNSCMHSLQISDLTMTRILTLAKLCSTFFTQIACNSIMSLMSDIVILLFNWVCAEQVTAILHWVEWRKVTLRRRFQPKVLTSAQCFTVHL